MLLHYDQLSDEHVTGESVSAAEYNSLVRILDSQVAAALEGVGEGVVSGGEVTAGSGLAVNVSPLVAVVRTEVGLVGLVTSGTTTVTGLPADTTLYLYAAANLEEGGGEEDSRESGVVVFTWQATGGELAGAVLLAKVRTASQSVASVTDLRVSVPSRQAAALVEAVEAQIDDLEAAVGGAYLGDEPPAQSLHDRVTALEQQSGGGGGTPAAVFWGALARAAGDPTTVDQAISAAIAAHEAAQAGDESQDTIAVGEPQWDVSVVNLAKAVLDVTAHLRTHHPDTLLDAVVIVPGVYGDGSGDTPDYVDRENSTWLP